MNDKIKKILIPFVIMVIFNLGVYYLTFGKNFGGGYSPHVGILLISGLLLGPYGAIGAVAGNFFCDLVRGYTASIAISSAVVGFGVSYLAYKLWYNNFDNKVKITKPRLDNTTHVLLFIMIILFCAALYAISHAKLVYLIYPNNIPIVSKIGVSYFVNFINSSFMFGIIGIWLSKHFNFFEVPEKSNKQEHEKIYHILGCSIILFTVIILIIDCIFNLTNAIVLVELVVLVVLLFAYLTKPFTSDVSEVDSNSIPESIMNRFLIIILILTIIGLAISSDSVLIKFADVYLSGTAEDVVISMLLVTDGLLLVFLIPSLSVLRYVENKVIEPITKFSKIKNFVKENQKIESEGLINIYSEYMGNDDEIGVLARSYFDLISHNNYYIENIQKIEGEKERIKAELDIATKIQQSNLPLEPIDNEYFIVNGYSHPAKEVGGDFFDYYEFDGDNLAIVIGDASGKGVPAALLATITQVMIKQLLMHEKNPSKILYSLNNQLCENNSEAMFITLWLGIYNKNTHKLTFANAGHNPPLIKHDNSFEFLKVNEGLVLGIMDDFKFEKEEIILDSELVAYTDGITDANNKYNEMYGEKRLIDFFNIYKNDKDPIKPLLEDIDKFIGGQEQFDDMTLMYLMIKDD